MKINKIADYCTGDFGEPTGHLDSQVFPCKKDPSVESRKKRKKKRNKRAFNLMEYKMATLEPTPEQLELFKEDTGIDLGMIRTEEDRQKLMSSLETPWIEKYPWLKNFLSKIKSVYREHFTGEVPPFTGPKDVAHRI